MPPQKAAEAKGGPAGKKTLSGVIQITRKGIGYVAWPLETTTTNPEKDIEVVTEHLAGALNGDIVEVEITTLLPRPNGKVVKIVSRAKTEFVGTLKSIKGSWVVLPADLKFYRPIHINNVPNETLSETKVLVQLISLDGTRDPEGAILETIGTAGEHRAEMNAIVLEHGFKTSFPPEVLAEAAAIEQGHAQTIASEVPKRTDYRDITTMTIDPLDAKDFDDALSVKELPGGEFEIGIHIADATFFVRPGTALDDEAVKRGTSVYLVDATIPMLPLELSGNVCSLREGEDRLAFSAVFHMNAHGEVLERRFEKSVIRSN